MVQTRTLKSTHGTICYNVEYPGATPKEVGDPILFIHGNSTSKQIFTHILETHHWQRNHPMFAIDLPGHGDSSDSFTPNETYTQPGYAKAIASWLPHMRLSKLMIVGWSLGGHIALELLATIENGELAGQDIPEIIGVMIVGSPPVGPREVPEGFTTARRDEGEEGEHVIFAATKDLSEEQIQEFAKGMTFRYEPWMTDVVRRTDGRAREIMWTAFEKMEGLNQREFVARTSNLLAVVNGASEPFIDLEFVKSLKYRNLWEGKCHELEGLGHAPFWEDWGRFEPILKRWVMDCEKKAGKDIEGIYRETGK